MGEDAGIRYHQNITIDGQDMPAEYANRKASNFFNEGKWFNFIFCPTFRPWRYF